MVQTNLTQTQDAASKKGTRAFVALRRSGELDRIGRSIIEAWKPEDGRVEEEIPYERQYVQVAFQFSGV